MGQDATGARPCWEYCPWHMAFPPALEGCLSGCRFLHWGMTQPPSPQTQEKQVPSSHPPEIVARGHVVVHVPGVQAAEGILGQAEGGGPVQVAVPFDLDAHDASLWVASRDSKLPSASFLERDGGQGLLLPRQPCPGSCAQQPPLFCQDGIWGRRDL